MPTIETYEKTKEGRGFTVNSVPSIIFQTLKNLLEAEELVPLTDAAEDKALSQLLPFYIAQNRSETQEILNQLILRQKSILTASPTEKAHAIVAFEEYVVAILYNYLKNQAGLLEDEVIFSKLISHIFSHADVSFYINPYDHHSICRWINSSFEILTILEKQMPESKFNHAQLLIIKETLNNEFKILHEMLKSEPTEVQFNFLCEQIKIHIKFSYPIADEFVTQFHALLKILPKTATDDVLLQTINELSTYLQPTLPCFLSPPLPSPQKQTFCYGKAS